MSSVWKQFLAALGAVFACFVCLIAVVFVLDHMAHQKFDKVASLNKAGYRGEVVGKKKPSEYRIGVFGGSVAYGYGEANEDSIAYRLQETLKKKDSKYTVLNLAKTAEHSVVRFQANYLLFEPMNLDAVFFLLTTDLGAVDLSLKGLDTDALLAFATNNPDKVRNDLRGHQLGDEPSKWQGSDILDELLAYMKDASTVTEKEAEAIDRIREQSNASMGEPYREDEIAVLRLWELNKSWNGVFDSVFFIPQFPNSSRTRNWFFVHFGYWFVLPEIAWEKYYMLVYGSVEEGYKKDKIRPLMTKLMSINASEEANENDYSTSLNSLTDFMSYLKKKGKKVVMIYGPNAKGDHSWDITRTYIGLSLEAFDNVHLLGPDGLFKANMRDDYYNDGLHYSKLGNETIANALLPFFEKQ